MMKRVIFIILIFLASLGSLSALTVKLGSPFPEGSAWDQSLRDVAQEWREISGGRVTLRIYPGGVAGDGPDMIRKMRIGQLDGGIFTSEGLVAMAPDTLSVSLPFILQSEEELDYVISSILPRFDEDFRENGFELMAWAKSGWVRMFASRELVMPEDLNGMRMAVGVSDQALTNSFIKLGYNVVPLNFNELMVALQNGLVDSFYNLPMAAAVYQWFGVANHMLEIPFSPVLGGFVLTSRTWSRIPEGIRDELKASLQVVSEDFNRQSEQMHQEAMEVMLENGLSVDWPTPAEYEAWKVAFSEVTDYVISSSEMIDPEVYEEIVQEIADFRATR